MSWEDLTDVTDKVSADSEFSRYKRCGVATATVTDNVSSVNHLAVT